MKKLTNLSNSFKQLMDISIKTKYFNKLLVGEKTNNNNNINIEFLDMGKVLCENIKREWIISQAKKSNEIHLLNPSLNQKNIIESTTNSNMMIELIINAFQSQFNINNKPLTNDFLSKIIAEHLICNNFDKDNSISFQNSEILISTSFTNKKNSKELFHKIQRQRKIWWKKFSANPGRFIISEPTIHEFHSNKIQSLTIDSKYNFGNITVEHLMLMPIKTIDSTIKSDKDLIIASMPLSIGTVETLFDAIDSSDYGEITLHRKIAPYQCFICCHSNDTSKYKDFHDLAEYLMLILKKSNIAILDIQKTTEVIINDEQLLNDFVQRMDSIGIPLGILLNDESLLNGTMGLRDRDTTLSETIHISDIPNYLVKILNSY